MLFRSWAQTSLKEVLLFLFPGYQINCPGVSLTDWRINKKSVFGALQDLKEAVGFYARVSFEKKSVECYWAYSFNTLETHVYHCQKNVRQTRLSYKRKEDVKLRINATAPQLSGKKLKVTVGSQDADARVISRNFNYVSSEDELKQLADKELETIRYDGYEGSISGFGLPRTLPGDALKIIDDKEPERSGTYLIESVDISYSRNGFARHNTISYKL